jgi:hypothetical protein
MLSFEDVRECVVVVAALPGARNELSRLGFGGGGIALRSSVLLPAVAVSSGIGAGEGLSSCEPFRLANPCGSRLRRFDSFEVEPVSGGGIVFMFAPSPICCSRFMCSDGTSNIDVGRDRSP